VGGGAGGRVVLVGRLPRGHKKSPSAVDHLPLCGSLMLLQKESNNPLQKNPPPGEEGKKNFSDIRKCITPSFLCLSVMIQMDLWVGEIWVGRKARGIKAAKGEKPPRLKAVC